MNRIAKTVGLLMLASFFVFSVFGQEITGSIVGTVTDSTGAVVPGASVTIADQAKGDLVVRSVTTNAAGEFSAPNVPPGVYKITVEATSFKKSNSSGVKVDVGSSRAIKVVLQPGSVTEEVTVEADPVAVDLVSASNGTIISGDQVRELSVNNRNFVQLVTLATGVTNDLSDQVYVGTVNPDGQANVVSIAVNGSRSSQNTFTVDGADVTDRGSNLTIQAYPSLDSIGEFRVLRSLYPAESGRSAGGQVNVVTRSGGNDFHGSFYEFVRNEKFNANDFFTNQTRSAGVDSDGKALRKPLRYNNFGWTVGGPVYFLRFGEVDPNAGMFTKLKRTFFFFSQEYRRDIRYPTLTSTVPTNALKGGVFPIDICVRSTDGTCTSTLPAGTPLTTMAGINPVSQQYVDYIYNNIPEPNTEPYSLYYPTKYKANFRQEIIKLDHQFSDTLSMYYRFEHDSIPTVDPRGLFSGGAPIPGVSITNTDSPGKTHTFQMTWAPNSNLIVDGGYSYGYGAILSHNEGLIALKNSPIRPTMPYANERDRVPTISGNGFTNITGFGPYDNFSWKQNFRGNLTWVAGSHTMKYGVVYSMYRKNENALAGNNEGVFSGFNTPGDGAIINAFDSPTSTDINLQAWANFLMGSNVTFSQASYDYTADLRQRNFEAYAQDEFRVRRNLTLYYGVRYSFFGSPWDKNGRLTNFDPSVFNQAQAPLVTGSGYRVMESGKNFCNGIIVNSQNYLTGPTSFNCTPTKSPWGKFIMDVPKANFAPRVGLAWDPFGKGQTVVRTGAGMYHDQFLNGVLLQQIGLNPPYQQTCSVDGVSMDNPVGTDCTIGASSAAASLRGVQPNWETPYSIHWSLDLQHQLFKNTLFKIGYYGSRGVHLIGSYELNEVKPGEALSTQCAVGGSTTPTANCLESGRAFFSSTQSRILDQIRPYRGWRSINMITPQYSSNYHSLQTSFEYRAARNFAKVGYTFGKTLTNNQTDRSTAPQNSYDIRSDYGRAQLDRRQVLTFNYSYNLPFYEKESGGAAFFLGGWQISGIATYQSGLPRTVTTSSFDPAGLGFIPALVAGARPNLLCDPNEGALRDQWQWFNTDCFDRRPSTSATDIVNAPGTSPRGVVNGPSTKRIDLTLSKNFVFGERFRLQLRGEAFNVLNTTNFRGLSTNNRYSSFGRVTSVRDPRTMQFGLKFYW